MIDPFWLFTFHASKAKMKSTNESEKKVSI